MYIYKKKNMKRKTKKYEGNKFKFKKNSIEKAKNKYHTTFEYVLKQILRYKKYINGFNNLIYYDKEQSIFNKKLVNAVESIGKDFNLDNTKIYSYNKFNRYIKKVLHKELKKEKKENICSKLKIINLYKKIDNKEYSELRQIAIKKPNDFLKAIYLYTICED